LSGPGGKKTSRLAVASLVLGVFFWCPFFGFFLGIGALVMGVMAYGRVTRAPDRWTGEGLAIAGIVLGALGVVIGGIVLLLALISLPGLLRARSVANESSAAKQVKVLSRALEVYALEHNGRYPANEEELLSDGSSYEGQPCDGKTYFGYAYSLSLSPDGYSVVAAPVACGSSGDTVYRVTRGGVLKEEPCAAGGHKKEGT
jgi:competence protein ComGC